MSTTAGGVRMEHRRSRIGSAGRGLLAAGATAVLTAAGCGTAPIAAPQDPVAARAYPKVVISAPLAGFVAVDYAAVVVDAPTADRPLRVMVPVRSTERAVEMALQYRFTWLDDAGREVGQAAWRTATLAPRVQDRFSGNAMSLRATDWRMEIRSAR